MSQPQILRENVVIHRILVNGQAEFTQDIFIDFVPDEMNVKYSYYYNDATELTPSLIHFSLINDYVCTIGDVNVLTPVNTTWNINKPVKGNFKFQVQDCDASVRSDRVGGLVIHLEFIKYLP